MNQDAILNYWIELYPNKHLGEPFLFEIQNEGFREEYYLANDDSFEFELYKISHDDTLLESRHVSQREMLQVIRRTNNSYWKSNINVPLISHPTQKGKYKHHEMLVCSDYKTIVHTLLETLTQCRYYYESRTSDDLIYIDVSNYLDDKVLDPIRFNIISFMFKTEYNEGYSGCLISIENTPYLISNSVDLEEPIYD